MGRNGGSIAVEIGLTNGFVGGQHGIELRRASNDTGCRVWGSNLGDS
jgi:hypothetical protein